MAETEIRFSIPGEMDSRVERVYPADGVPERNEAVYFDTSDFALRRRGIEFRVRHNEKGWKQTVKAPAPGAPFTRAEHEIPLGNETPNLDHLRRSIPADAADDIAGRALQPVFRTNIERRRVVVPRDGGEIEVAVDHGRLIAGNTSVEIDEIEHELLSGSPTNLAQACLAFLDDVPCGLLTEGKAARGFRLVTAEAPQPLYARPVDIAPDTSIPDAVRTLLRAAFAQVLGNHAALVDESQPESVHQMRIGIRRMRSILSAFAPVLDLRGARDLIGETRLIFEQLGEIRDADVFAGSTIDDVPLGASDTRLRDALLSEVTAYRRRRRDAVADYLSGPAFARLAVRWLAWIEGGDWLRHGRPIDRLLAERPVHEFAAHRLVSMNRKMLKRGHKACSGTIDDWHRARIAAKKVRYAGGPLRGLLEPDEARRVPRAESLARLQDDLGHFNDLCNVEPFLAVVGKTVARGRRNAYAEASAFCAGWSRAETDHAIRRLRKTWKAFEEATADQRA